MTVDSGIPGEARPCGPTISLRETVQRVPQVDMSAPLIDETSRASVRRAERDPTIQPAEMMPREVCYRATHERSIP